MKKGKKFGIIFLVLLILHVIIFRDIVWDTPAIIAGEKSIVRDELIPFFDFKTQFFDQMKGGLSPLTETDEIRISYSFWSSWVRHYSILPVALILLNTVSAFIIFYAFFRISQFIFKRTIDYHYAICFIATLLLHFFLIYSKIAHFYTLIFGFSLFALSLSLTLIEIYNRNLINWKRVLIISLLTLLNPAIHYHILYYFISIFIVGIFLFIRYFSDKNEILVYLRRSMIVLCAIFCISIIPYAIFISLILSNGDSEVTNSIPVNYWMIYYTSNSFGHLFSLDTTAQIDMFREGSYLVETPRFAKILLPVMLVGFIFFIMKHASKVGRKNAELFYIIVIVLMLSIWMSLGYTQGFSFHSLLQKISGVLSQGQGIISDVGSRILSIFIQVLRFPHRFTFIEHYFFVLSLVVGAGTVLSLLRRAQRRTFTILFAVLVLSPLFMISDYRSVLLSGNMDGYLEPYTIPQDLKDIRKVLGDSSDSKMFILPSLESGREIGEGQGSVSFIDKYFIYYLNQPSFYYGTGASVTNKIQSFIVYDAILNNSGAWDVFLRDNIGITHILVPKEVDYRENGLVYVKNLEQILPTKLGESSVYSKVHAGDQFDLYELSSAPNRDDSFMIDLAWEQFRDFLGGDITLDKFSGKKYIPVQYSNFLKIAGSKIVVSDSFEKVLYDIYGVSHKDNVFYPVQDNYPFTDEITTSTFYTNSVFSLFTLFDESNPYNFYEQSVYDITNIQTPNFIGYHNDIDVKIPISVDKSGTHRVLLKGSTTNQSEEIYLDIGGESHILRPSQLEGQSKRLFGYYFADIEIGEDVKKVVVKNVDKDKILIESLLIIPAEDIPEVVNDRVKVDNFTIIKREEGLYSVEGELGL